MSLLAVEAPLWVCSACATQNPAGSLGCHMCGSFRLVQTSQQTAGESADGGAGGGFGFFDGSKAHVTHSGQFPSNARGALRGGANPSPATMQSPALSGAALVDPPELHTQKRDPRLGQNADEDERRATEEGRKVFVGNLKRPITRQEVIDHFSKFGEVERVILNSGFGLVLMSKREGALKATEQRWQALDWRNVEVFVYTKGAKGASWNRPYAVPPKPGPCSICQNESAEHCSLCTSSLCLNDEKTCVMCCRTCQRSFCLTGKECGSKDGVDACDTCGAPTCLFCALRLEAVCAQCGKQFSTRLQNNARDRARRLVNARISENDGSVYALVCLLKGDVESSREGQLVASIDRASKLFNPKASSWCMVTALRAIKELEDAWEATRRVHNLRALRRSAKQWSTDLTSLTVPGGIRTTAPQQNDASAQAVQLPGFHHPSQIHHQQQQQHSSRGNRGGHSNNYHTGYNGYFQPPHMINVSAPNSMPAPMGRHSHHHHAMANGGNGNGNGYAPSPFPYSFSSAQQQQHLSMATSNNGINSSLSNAFLSANPRGEDSLHAALRAAEIFLTELDPRPKTETDWLLSHLRNIALSVTKKRSVFLEELCIRVEVWTLLLRRFSPGSVAQSTTTASMTPMNALKRAVIDLDSFYLSCKTAGEFIMRKDAYLGELLRAAREVKRNAPPFSAADTLIKRAGRSARNTEIRASLVAAQLVPFEMCLHNVRYRRCLIGPAQCPFSHHIPTTALPMSDVDQREFDAADYEFSNGPDELYAAAVAEIGRPVAYASKSANTSKSWDSTWTPFQQPPVLSMHEMREYPDWNSAPDRLIAALTFGERQIQDGVAVKQQVAELCGELNLREYQTQIEIAFIKSGAVELGDIWEIDLTRLHKELLNVGGLPASCRIKIINLVTARRVEVAPPLPSELISQVLDVPVPWYEL